MAKTKGKGTTKGKTTAENFVLIGKNGEVVIGSGTGDVSSLSVGALSNSLKTLIEKRQQAGHELTAALEQANFPVAGSVQAHVIDPMGILDPGSKSKSKAKKG